MKELFVTLSVLIVLFFFGYLLLPNFKSMKAIIIFCELIISSILLSNNFYKKHSLYKGSKFLYIQRTDFYPIKSFYKTLYENGEFKSIEFDKVSSNEFSLIQTKKYSKECLNHYYIQANDECPITDIKLEETNENINEDYIYIQITDNEYLSYTNKNKKGKLYKSFNYTDFKENIEDNFTNEKIIRKEYNKFTNPINDFKFYIQFFDVLSSLLIFISFVYSFFEYPNDRKFGVFRVCNIAFQIFIFVIYILRYMKFIKVKNFLNENKDLYENESYFPNKYFNIDSFPLSLPVIFIIYNLVYIIFPHKNHYFKDKILEIKFSKYYIYMIIFYATYFIAVIILSIFDYINDLKINAGYNNLIYNWELNPFKSIEVVQNEESKYAFKWRNNIFKIEKFEDLNYIDLYQNNNGKICGKDDYGNNLYFPEDSECPINNIYISNSNEDLTDYKKLKLNETSYLYYTNQNTEGKIIVDLRISNIPEIPLNPEGKSDYNYFSMPFYEEIDFDVEYLYSINYLGVNSSSHSGKTKLIKDFKNKIKSYKGLSITKFVLFWFCYIIIFLLMIFINMAFSNDYNIFYSESNPRKSKIITIISFVCLIIFVFSYTIILIICTFFHNKYIKDFMNDINLDFQNDKNDYKWNAVLMIFFFFLVFYISLYSQIYKKFEFYEPTSEDNTEEIEKENNYNPNNAQVGERVINYRNNRNLETMNSIDRLNKQNDQKEGENQISVIFQCIDDQTVHYPVICKESQKFSEVEKLLYEQFPRYKKTINYFMCNGNIVDKTKTLKENKIGYGNVIIMKIAEEDAGLRVVN